MFHVSEPDWDGIDLNRTKPPGNPVILQSWHDLIFFHARVSVENLRALVPSSLTVEEFDGSGWLGFVPFRMSGIRSPRAPAVPWLSSFYETNVRTYVTHPEHGPGVWFFSLDASRYLACWYARQVFKLPYFHSILTGQIDDDSWVYSGHRKPRQLLPETGCDPAMLTDYLVSVRQAGPWHQAERETFEFWLVERYRLYSKGKGDQLFTSRVFHEPYTIATGNANRLEINGMDSAFGNLDFQSVLLAKTVNVQCFSIEQVS